MLPSNPICAVCDYGTSATYRDLPSDEQLRNGVVPLDSLPAAWWNCMWNMTNHSINQARSAVGVLINEINTVLEQAGVCACDVCVDQLYKAIDNISQTIGNAVRAGAVKSSSCCGQVSIDNNGIMTANGLGNAACLTTTAQNAIGAINELKSTYDSNFSNVNTTLSGKAPTSHASSDTSYGVGSAANYGHLKISDQYTSVLAACSGVAASQQALTCVYCYAAGVAAAALGLGNAAGCALGTAAAGTATTAARSDHVHPLPTEFKAVCSWSADFGNSLVTIRNADSGAASVAFRRKATTLGYLAQADANCRFVRYNAAATTYYTILDTSATITVAQGGTGVTTQEAINCAFIANLNEGTSDVTDCTQLITSFASNCGFSDPAAVNVPYKRKACAVYNYMKGKFGTAAQYACGCFLGATAKACCSATADSAGLAYCVMDYCSNATPLYIAYACAGLTCAQITHLAAFSTNYITGKTVIKDACKANVQSWLGLSSAAYCAATAFRASTWTPSCVACAGANGSGTAFGSAAVCAASCFLGATAKACCAAWANCADTAAYASCALLADYACCACAVLPAASYNACNLNVTYCGLTICRSGGIMYISNFCATETYIVSGWYCCWSNQYGFSQLVGPKQAYEINVTGWDCCRSNTYRCLGIYSFI